MRLRKLEIKDAPLMLEWMHDPLVVKDMQERFGEKTVDDCKNFIKASQNMSYNLHLAITDDDDEYIGTVSLKHITKDSAEFAIVIRESFMGKGYAKYGMAEIIRIGLEEMNLKSIYWCVSPKNKRAIAFYDKNGYSQIMSDTMKILGGYSQEQIEQYIWYQVKKK